MAIISPPKEISTYNVKLLSNLSGGGDFYSGFGLVLTASGILSTGGTSGDGVIYSSAKELASGESVQMVVLGGAWGTAGNVISGGQSLVANANGALSGVAATSGKRVIGRALGTTTDTYASGSLFPLFVNIQDFTY